MVRLRWICVALLLSCQENGTEAEQFLAALDREEPALCRTLSVADHAEECLTLLAADLGEPALCEELQTFWRDECFFFVADTAAPPIGEALALCARAGKFQARCRAHVFDASIARFLEQHGEPRSYPVLEVFLAPHIPEPKRAKMIESVLSTYRFTQLDPQAPLRRSACAGIPDNVCQVLAHKHFVRAIQAAPAGALRRQLCPSPVPLARAEELGLPTWDVALDPVVQRAWRAFCTQPPARRRR